MTQPTETDTIWVTQEAYDRLQQELDHLRGDVRADITAKIASARDEGDLKENGGYHAAREEQGKTEARIRQLEDMLRRAEVGDKPADDGTGRGRHDRHDPLQGRHRHRAVPAGFA